MPGLLFSGGALGLALQAAWSLNSLGSLFIAATSPAQGKKARAIGGGIVLEESDPGFTDRLKIETQGAGFPLVLAATTAGASIMKALGSASVLGRVFLLLPAREPARVDLHSTINYKSLTVEGVDIFGGDSVVTDEELRSVMEAVTELRLEILAGALFRHGEDTEGDRFEIR
jgi:NADPH:quinone reductase-like Zn-dependent oxidoreductase